MINFARNGALFPLTIGSKVRQARMQAGTDVRHSKVSLAWMGHLMM